MINTLKILLFLSLVILLSSSRKQETEHAEEHEMVQTEEIEVFSYNRIAIKRVIYR